ncbi:MAG: heavy-metal-associated domain-containing protein [Collimonas sp.]|uniref:heavy-metal-associated domain-containing protein n=1 Tax=Collimonas sp. TaxID=1963772 RepID=UPI003264600F
MIEFNVQDMTCGHCAGRITKAISGVDAGAKVDIKIDSHTVSVQSNASSDELAEAIKDAGYTPQLRS